MAVNFNISSFKEAIGAGSRPNLFRIVVTPPSGYVLPNFTFLCRSASLPADSMGLIEVPMNAGRRLKIAGDRTFPDFTTTVLNDEGFIIRSNVEKWQNDIVKTNFNLTKIGRRSVATTSDTNTTALTTGSMEVYQLDGTGADVNKGKVKLFNCWPSDISAIDLSYDTTDSIEEFTITWTYDYHVHSFESESESEET